MSGGGSVMTVSAALLIGAAGFGAASVGFQSALREHGLRLEKKPVYAEDGRTLSSLPRELPTWVREGVDHIEEAEVQAVLGTDNYVTRTYVRREADASGRRPRIQFHAAYYTGLIDTVPHVPERCFVGGGLQKARGGSRRVALPLDTSRWSPDVTAPEGMAPLYRARTADQSRRVRLPRDPHGLEMLTSAYDVAGEHVLRAGYFFIANGGWTPEAEGVRLLAFNLQDEYAYYLKVQFTSTDYATDEEFAVGAAGLLDELFGDLMLCVPDWVRVLTEGEPANG